MGFHFEELVMSFKVESWELFRHAVLTGGGTRGISKLLNSPVFGELIIHLKLCLRRKH